MPATRLIEVRERGLLQQLENHPAVGELQRRQDDGRADVLGDDVGGTEAPRTLGQPIDGTLFFAGEATDLEGRTGTVDSAIVTGRRAARQVLRALRT